MRGVFPARFFEGAGGDLLRLLAQTLVADLVTPSLVVTRGGLLLLLLLVCTLVVGLRRTFAC
jgi:hypothetical protein